MRVLGAAAGLSVSKVEPDCTGIDFMIRATREVDDDFPAAMVQVKTWSVPRDSGDAWRYSELTQKRYNALAGRRRIPHYLFLVHRPARSWPVCARRPGHAAAHPCCVLGVSGRPAEDR